MRKLVLSVVAFLGVLCGTAVAQAQVSVRLEPGLAIPMNFPQADKFTPGVAGDAKLDIDLTRWLDTGPSISELVMPSQSLSTNEAGTAFGIGWGGRLKRPHDLGTWNKINSISPWVDADLQLIETGSLTRSAVFVGIGAEMPTSESRQLWVGPFARYMDVPENYHNGYYNQDLHELIVGLTFEFGGRDQTPHAKPLAPLPPPPVETKKVENAPTPAPVPEEVAPKLDQRVQFAFDSSVIRGSEESSLAQVVFALKSGKYDATVEGYASSEGQLQHNMKLSQRRADAVVDYLVGKGVARDRLTAVGRGISNPVASNATEAGRVKNRRVEFTVSITLRKKDQ